MKSRNLPALFFRHKRAGDNKSIVLSMFNIVVLYFNIFLLTLIFFCIYLKEKELNTDFSPDMPKHFIDIFGSGSGCSERS